MRRSAHVTEGERRTLACFDSEYNQGTEFKKMAVSPGQIFSSPR
jgi:hypothetical protein